MLYCLEAFADADLPGEFLSHYMETLCGISLSLNRKEMKILLTQFLYLLSAQALRQVVKYVVKGSKEYYTCPIAGQQSHTALISLKRCLIYYYH